MKRWNRLKQSSPYALQSMLLWSFAPIFLSFLPVYLQQNQLNASQIGIVMAINPLIAVFLQSLFGPLADRTRSKNRLFNLFTAAAIVFILFFPFGVSFHYFIIAIALFSIVQTPMIPISESITLESLEEMKSSYAPVRMMGTVGFAMTSVLVGYLLSWKIESYFYLIALIGVGNILITGLLPTVKGHQGGKEKAPYREILRNKKLSLFVLLLVIAQLSLSLYMTYLPMYYLSIGGLRAYLGWIYFIMGSGEVLVLMFADKIIERLGIQNALGLSISMMGLRFLALLVIDAPIWMIPVSLMNGFTYIIFGFGLAVYMNSSVRKELKTTGQSVLALASAVGRVIGALSGGFLISSFGLKNTMAISAALCFLTLGLYYFILRRISVPKEEGSLIHAHQVYDDSIASIDAITGRD
ncbi:MFS transporter [Oceanispirochaeta sp.]|jgi:PPP family 3-phenylpropionic acid transporter|uniref:MFS transporter n=1 Tax=Oceanispirochaeta sp. TaxID=2035350 RepID=UPI00260881C9|nr:MFS transporter [Oceanispirochaeta sp.]MDA3957853.1 MFS transporter [Oceanispirochaeta sp.]